MFCGAVRKVDGFTADAGASPDESSHAVYGGFTILKVGSIDQLRSMDGVGKIERMFAEVMSRQ